MLFILALLLLVIFPLFCIAETAVVIAKNEKK